MSGRFIKAAITINNHIKPAELRLHEAAIGSAGLLHTLLVQHAESGAPDAIGLAAIGHAARAAALTVEAREAAIRAHGALNLDLRKVGLSEMMGKEGPLPENGPGFAEVFTTGRVQQAAIAVE